MSSNAIIGIAGVHHVVSELSRRGLVALPTIRNVAAYDIVVVARDGTRHANLQVKASSKRVTFFPMPASENVRAGPRDYYVLVRWLKKTNCFECFMLTGRRAREAVESSVNFQKKRIHQGSRKVLFPSIYVGPKNDKRAKQWRKTWQTWNLE